MRNYLFLTVLCFTACSGPDTPVQAPDWFTDRGNLGHAASQPNSIPLPLEERWQVTLGSSIRSSVIGAFGLLFVGADDQKLYALDPEDGTTVWTFAADGPISNTATGVGENKGAIQRVWFMTEASTLYALDATNGSELWSLPGGAGPFHSSTNYASGYIYQTYMSGGTSSTTRAVSGSTGNVEWSSNTFNISTATPMHGAGLLFVGKAQVGTTLTAYDPISGEVEWDFWEESEIGQGANTSGVVDTDVGIGNQVRLYISVKEGEVRGLRAIDGGTLWTETLTVFGRITGLALSRNQSPNVLVVAQFNHLYGLNPVNGDVLWDVAHASNSVDPTSRVTPKPAIYGDTVFHIEGGNTLVGRSLSDGAMLWSTVLSDSTVSSPTVGGNAVFIATSGGKVHAFAPVESE